MCRSRMTSDRLRVFLFFLRQNRRAERRQLDDVLRKYRVENPVDRDTHLFRKAGKLAKINAAPEPPGNETGKSHSKYFRHAHAAPDRSQHAEHLELERLWRLTIQRRHNIVRQRDGLTDGVLRRRRIELAGIERI